MKQIELAYKIARTFEGTHEESGSKQNQTIIDFHRATTLHAKEDEVPWCSSFMNFCQLQACFILNSGLMARIMSHKLMAKDIPIMQKYAIDLCDKLGFENQAIFLKNTDLSKNANQKSNGVEIVEPTYSALAASWKGWGVATDEPTLGDLVVFKRRPDGTGSGHISFFNGFSGNINRVVYCYGGNQSNACIDSTYELDRVVTFRTLKQDFE